MPRPHKDASANSSSPRGPLVVSPLLLREASTLHNLTSTFTPILDGISSGWRSVSSGATAGHFSPGRSASARGPLRRTNTASRSPSGTSPDEDEEYGGSMLPAQPSLGDPSRPALFSVWSNVGSRRRLLVVVERQGLRCWDATDLEAVTELSWIRWDRLIQPNDEDDSQPLSVDIWADHEDDTEVAVLFSGRRGSKTCSRVDIVSLSTQSIRESVEVQGIATSFAFNSRTLVIATREPCSLHLFSRQTLKALPCSPIQDVAGLKPTFALGNSRWLAYATTTPPNEREPPIAGRGFFEKFHGSSTSHDEGQPDGSPGSSRSPGSWRESLSTSGDAVETAKRVGGGLMSGAKALGNWWSGASEATTAITKHNTAGEAYSRSAPQSLVGPIAGGSPSQNASSTSRRRSLIYSSASSHVSHHGHVKVIDLGPVFALKPAPPKVVAVITASSDPISHISFNPSSSWLFVANSEGHYFDIFEMRPQTRIGRSAVRGYPPNSKAKRECRLWHRYRLNRGMTTASVKSVSWSPDSRLVAVATDRGTHHIFALHPAGGSQDSSAVFGAVVANRQSFAPLSVNLNSFTKIRSRMYAGNDAEPSPSHLQRQDLSFSSALLWIGLTPVKPDETKRLSSSTLLSEAHYKWPAALHYDGLTGQLTLHRVEARRTPSVRATTAPALSGLSQLMQRRLSTSTGVKPITSGDSLPNSTLSAVGTAMWELQAPLEVLNPESVTIMYPPSSTDDRGMAERWTSFAEIDTFSRSPNILPKSIYAAQQFSFSLIDGSYEDDLMTGDLGIRKTLIKVRKEVEIAPGSGTLPLSGLAIRPGESRYGEPIRSAVETILDTARPFSPESPSYLAPGFPNGLPAKHGNRWSSAMSMTAAQVKPSLAGAQDFVRRVRQSRQISSSEAIVENVASVSFEDDQDAIRVESQGIEHVGTPGSNLSEQDNGIGGGEDWDNWSDDGRPGSLRSNQITRHRLGASGLAAQRVQSPPVSPPLGPAPFELDEEWDDPMVSRAMLSPSTGPMSVMTPTSLGSHHKKRHLSSTDPLASMSMVTKNERRSELSSHAHVAIAGMDLPQGLSSLTMDSNGEKEDEHQQGQESRYVASTFNVGFDDNLPSILTQPVVSMNEGGGSARNRAFYAKKKKSAKR